MNDFSDPVKIVVDRMTYELKHLTDPRTILKELLWTAFDPRSSAEAIQTNLNVLADFIDDIRREAGVFDKPAAKVWRGFCTKMSKSFRMMATVENRDVLIHAVYDALLRLDGLGTLPHFCATGGIEHGMMNYDPERRSIMKTY